MRDSTNPASRSTRRCLETDGCDSRSSRSISPTERSDERSRLRMARLLGSATMANDDSTVDIYPIVYMYVKAFYATALATPSELPVGAREARVRGLPDVAPVRALLRRVRRLENVCAIEGSGRRDREPEERCDGEEHCQRSDDGVGEVSPESDAGNRQHHEGGRDGMSGC